MIKIVQGNLLKAPEFVIMHQANCFHTMGAGVAAQIKYRFPEAYQADLETPRGDIRKLGTYSKAHSNSKVILNVYGQYNYGRGLRQTSYDALDTAFREINRQFMQWPKKPSIAAPFNMGCALGGGDFDIVYLIAQKAFTDIDVTFYRLDSV